MYTKRTSIIIKRIVVVLSSILLVGIIYTKIRDETHSCMGVPIIAEELLQGKLKQEKEIGNIISLKQKMLPYDKENSRIYIPCTVDEETKIYDFQGKLESSLSEYKLYDAKVWIPQALALVNHNEMVEVTHNLNERRQKIRARIEKSTEVIKGHMKDIETLLPDLSPEVAAHVREIMETVEKLGVTR